MDKFKVVGLSSLDPDGFDTVGEPDLDYVDALKAAQEFKAQGKAFRVITIGTAREEHRRAFAELGAII